MRGIVEPSGGLNVSKSSQVESKNIVPSPPLAQTITAAPKKETHAMSGRYNHFIHTLIINSKYPASDATPCLEQQSS